MSAGRRTIAIITASFATDSVRSCRFSISFFVQQRSRRDNQSREMKVVDVIVKAVLVKILCSVHREALLRSVFLLLYEERIYSVVN